MICRTIRPRRIQNQKRKPKLKNPKSEIQNSNLQIQSPSTTSNAKSSNSKVLRVPNQKPTTKCNDYKTQSPKPKIPKSNNSCQYNMTMRNWNYGGDLGCQAYAINNLKIIIINPPLALYLSLYRYYTLIRHRPSHATDNEAPSITWSLGPNFDHYYSRRLFQDRGLP